MANNIAKRSGFIERADGSWFNEGDFITRNQTPFNDLRTVSRSSQFTYKSNFPLSSQRDVETTSNNGTITQQNGAEYRLRATADADSEAILETKQKGDYEPGTLLRSGIGIRAPSEPTGISEWGYANGTNGAYFQYGPDGLEIVLKSGGSIVSGFPKAQSEWNLDPLDGTGASGITLDPSDGHVYQVELFYYGYGYVEWGIEVFDKFNYSTIVPVHRYKSRGQVLIQEPNLPLRARIDSESSGTQQDIFVAGRQVESIGKKERLFRSTGEVRSVTDVTTDWRPTVSVQSKAGYENIFCEIDALDIISDQDMEVGIFRNATLNNDNFTDPSEHEADEVATQYDTDSNTTFTPANMIWRGLIVGGTGSQTNITGTDLPDKPIVDGDQWTVAVRAFTGTGHTARVVLRVRENW